MPRRDGTGPMEKSPMSGREMGICAESKQREGQGFGRGAGNGFNRGYGLNNKVVSIQQDELAFLKNQVSLLQSNLSNVNEKISKLEQK